MDNFSAWKALAAACHAFADTLEAELIAANKNLATQTDRNRRFEAPAKAETAEDTPAKAETVTPEEAPVAAETVETTSDDTSEEKEITLPEIRAFLAEKSRAGFTDKVKELLKAHGNSKLSGIDPAEYAAIMKEAEDLGS